MTVKYAGTGRHRRRDRGLFTNLTKNFDDVDLQRLISRSMPSGFGRLGRLALPQINDNGALEVTMVTTDPSCNMTFQKKAKDAFGMIVSSAMELT